MKKMSYLNDFEYAKSYFENKHSGFKKLEFELRQKGISDKVIREVLSEIEIDEKDKIESFKSKIKNKEKDKQIAYLIRKGFDYETVMDFLKKEEMGE